MTQPHEGERTIFVDREGNPVDTMKEAAVAEIETPDGLSTILVPADSKGDPFGPRRPRKGQ